AATGRIHADTIEGLGAPPESDTGKVLELEVARHLCAMEGRDRAGGLLERRAHVRIERAPSAIPRLTRHLERCDLDLVKALGHLAERGIAARMHVRDDAADCGNDRRVRSGSALEEHALRRRWQRLEHTVHCHEGAATRFAPSHIRRATHVTQIHAHGINLSMRVTRMPSAPTCFSSAMMR